MDRAKAEKRRAKILCTQRLPFTYAFHSLFFLVVLRICFQEFWVFPFVKINWISFIGLLMVLLGQGIRSLAMWTCGDNFHHLVQHNKNDGHQLVTSGIYGFVRHPSYCGFYIWAVGTQLLLCNPLCTVLYVYVSYKFFEERITNEEYYLFEFFGTAYSEYHSRVWSGIPLLKTEDWFQKRKTKD